MATKTRRLADLLANIDDNSQVTSAGLKDATITAADLADDSVGAAEIIDDAITAAAIADDAVGAAALASNAVVSASIVDNAVTGAKIAADTIPVKPHIQPGMLYPAWSGLLDNHTGFTFTDSSPTGHSIVPAGFAGSISGRTGHGDTHHSGAQKKIGSTSIRFDSRAAGNEGTNLEIADHADWDFGTGAWTIETWVYFTRLDVQQGIIEIGGDGDDGWRVFAWHNSSGLQSKRDHSVSGDYTITATGGTGVLTVNTWHHLAVSRASGGVVTLYVDGVAKGTATPSGNLNNDGSGAKKVTIGNQFNSSAAADEYFSGYLDEIRITRGVNVYTGAFTPPTSALTTTWSAGTNIAANSTAGNVKLLIHSDNGGHSGAYGTTQADGKKYYYTDIRESEPIKDPRIGAYFGTQRHKVRSFQGKEISGHTAEHTTQTFSTIDGKDYFRVCGRYGNNQGGAGFDIELLAKSYLEFTGYFSDINIQALQYTSLRHFTWSIDGGNRTTNTGFRTGINMSVTTGRFHDEGGWENVGLSETLGLHTIKIENRDVAGVAQDFRIYGLESIAQEKITDATCDTTNADATVTMDSTSNISAGMSVTGTGVPAGTTVASVTNATTFELSANATAGNSNQTFTFGAENIQIPAQNIVSYGKKFALSAAKPHYNPFHGMTGAKTLSQLGAYIDTATSLGMHNWKAGTANYYKPWNGGRVVKWIASDGTIKTSVTMMPPNAQNMGGTASNAVTNTEVQNGTNGETINFDTGGLDHSLQEIAVRYHWREFGNGAGNGRGGTNQDATMLQSATDDLQYVMEDGLTALACGNGEALINGINNGLSWGSGNSARYLTFIGTGLTIHSPYNPDGSGYTMSEYSVAQNMPYGTHIYSKTHPSHNTLVNGIEIRSGNHATNYPDEFIIHQPKMPPIPTDACVIADYMLMADFVPQATAGAQHISKGVRQQSCVMDIKHNDTGSNTLSLVRVASDNNANHGFKIESSAVADNDTTITFRLPSFATNWVGRGYQQDTRAKMFLDTTDKDAVSHRNNSTSHGSFCYITNNSGNSATITSHEPLGVLKCGINTANGLTSQFTGMDIVTPIHTSHHYQKFDSPFYSEMLGGDRNMEQTNLICSPDGKTWDQVSRNTSYLGPRTHALVNLDGGHVSSSNPIIWDEIRGINDTRPCFTKNIAVAWDKFIILEDGMYEVTMDFYNNTPDCVVFILKNQTTRNVDNGVLIRADSSDDTSAGRILWQMKRGDFIYTHVEHGGTNTFHGSDSGYQQFQILKLEN